MLSHLRVLVSAASVAPMPAQRLHQLKHMRTLYSNYTPMPLAQADYATTNGINPMTGQKLVLSRTGLISTNYNLGINYTWNHRYIIGSA